MTTQKADHLTNPARGDNAAVPAPFSPRAFSIPEFCRRYGIGRTAAYGEIAAGRLRAVKAGRRTLVTQDDAEACLASRQELNSRVAPSQAAE